MYHLFISLIALGSPLSCDESVELLSLMKPYSPNKLHTVKTIVEHTDPVCFVIPDVPEDAKAD